MRQDFQSILCSKVILAILLSWEAGTLVPASLFMLNGRMRNGWDGQYRVEGKTDAWTVVLSVQLPPGQETGRIRSVF